VHILSAIERNKNLLLRIANWFGILFHKSPNVKSHSDHSELAGVCCDLVFLALLIYNTLKEVSSVL